MARQHLEETWNFVIFGEDAGSAAFLNSVRPRATALRTVCEGDFKALASLFGATGRFGDDNNKVQVVLDPTQALFGGGAIGQNAGFAGAGQTTITLATAGSIFTGRSAVEVDDAIAAAFVAELAEVLLSLRGQDGKGTLNPGNCDGEGFSRVMAAWRHPRGYYEVIGKTLQYANGPSYPVVHWMNEAGPDPRSNYLDDPYSSDSYPAANGCAIAFLHFLHHQVGTSWAQVVVALDGTLPATFARITGRPDGFAEMRRILDAAFPIGTALDWAYEDPFPLADARRRHVEFVSNTSEPSSDPVFAADVIAEGDIKTRPTPICPEGTYHYQVVLTHSGVGITATAIGFGRPVFEWTVNDVGNSGQAINLTAVGSDDDPSLPSHRKAHTADVSLTFASLDTPQRWATPSSSTLSISIDGKPPGIPGHFTIPVGLAVRDEHLSDAPVVWNTWAYADLETLIWDDQFYKDRDACQAWWHDQLRRHELFKEIQLLRTLPDPPPLLERLFATREQLGRELRVLHERAPDLAEQVEAALRRAERSNG